MGAAANPAKPPAASVKGTERVGYSTAEAGRISGTPDAKPKPKAPANTTEASGFAPICARNTRYATTASNSTTANRPHSDKVGTAVVAPSGA